MVLQGGGPAGGELSSRNEDREGRRVVPVGQTPSGRYQNGFPRVLVVPEIGQAAQVLRLDRGEAQVEQLGPDSGRKGVWTSSVFPDARTGPCSIQLAVRPPAPLSRPSRPRAPAAPRPRKRWSHSRSFCGPAVSPAPRRGGHGPRPRPRGGLLLDVADYRGRRGGSPPEGHARSNSASKKALAQDPPDLPRPATEGAERAGRSGPTRRVRGAMRASSDCFDDQSAGVALGHVCWSGRRCGRRGGRAARGERRACRGGGAASVPRRRARARPAFRQAQPPFISTKAMTMSMASGAASPAGQDRVTSRGMAT